MNAQTMESTTKNRLFIIQLAVDLILLAFAIWARYFTKPLLEGIAGIANLNSIYFLGNLDLLIIIAAFLTVYTIFNQIKKGAWELPIPDGKTLVIILALLIVLIYGWTIVQILNANGHLGLPTDDSWIHMVFAKNIAHGYDLSFNPGELSTGSSSPLWTYILAGGLWLGLSPVAAACLLSGIFFLLSLYFSYNLANDLLKSRLGAALVTILLAVQFYTVWDTLSGLEISLMTALTVGAFWLVRFRDFRWWLGMVFLGLLQLSRVEGIFVIAVILGWQLIDDFRKNLPRVLGGILIIGLIVLPMALKYLSISGSILPQTFFVKTGVIQLFFIVRVLKMLALFLAFPSFILFTIVLAIAAFTWIKHRSEIRRFLPIIILIVVTVGAYILNLRYGVFYFRYIHHLIPLFLILLLNGILLLSENMKRLVITMLVICTGLISLIHSSQIAVDIREIEQMQVRMAKWAAEDIPPGEKIAVNDVGAMGYFSQHYIVDLMGLVGEPMKSAGRMKTYKNVDDLLRENIHYMIIYPFWYPDLVDERRMQELAFFPLPSSVNSEKPFGHVAYYIVH